MGVRFTDMFVESWNYIILFLDSIASSSRVTEENLVFETVQSGPWSSFECFSALKETHFYISFVVTAAGVVLCGSPKKQPLTSSIVQFIYFSFGPLGSAEIFREIRKFHMFRPIFSKQCFVIWTLFGFILVFLLTALLKLQYPFSGFDCQFIQGHWKEFSIRHWTVWAIFFFWMFSLLLKEPTFIIYMLSWWELCHYLKGRFSVHIFVFNFSSCFKIL